MTSPKEEAAGHPPDFRVRYRFLSADEGGREQLPSQGYRSDFSYDGDDPAVDGIFMVHPEFEAPDGSVLEEGAPVSRAGTARMWVLVHDMREQLHRHRARVGVHGYFMEGGRRVAEAEIVEIVGLHTNEGKRWGTA